MYSLILLLVISVLTIWVFNHQLNWQREDFWQTRKAQRVQHLWSLAQKKMRENDFLEAEKTLLTILTLNPENAPAYNRLGILYAKQKDYNDAITCFTAAFNIQKNANSLHNLGLVYYNLERYEEAGIALKQALELDDQSARRHIEYSKVLERLGRQNEMILALEKAAELDPTPPLLKLLLKTYKVNKITDKAQALEEKINTSIQSRPKSTPQRGRDQATA